MAKKVKLEKLELLKNRIQSCGSMHYKMHSRIHPMPNFSLNSKVHCFVKRDDELGFGISGNKLRKYNSLLSYLIEKEHEEAVLLGGPHSNNLLSLTQLLIENQIKPTLFLRGTKPACSQGNFLLLQMLLPESSMRWIPRKEWENIEIEIAKYLEDKPKCIAIPEGAACFPSLPGALTLPLDIVQNEIDLGFSFDHIFMDAGTGFTAASLLLGLAFLERQTSCHLLLLADGESEFLQKLQEWHSSFESWMDIKCPMPTHFTCWKSSLAPSFGSTNSQVFKFIVENARSQGFFVDPIYSGKLFHQAKQKLEKDSSIQGNVLMIHSGGALSLLGFQDRLEKMINF